MISIKSSKKYCNEIEKIENYELAVADKDAEWICHHRMEEVFSHRELIRAGWYYNRRPEELIFIKRSEHDGNPKLHHAVRERIRRQIGRPSGTLGRVMPEEEKKRRSKSRKEYYATHDALWKHRPQSEYSNKKRSDSVKEWKNQISALYKQHKLNGGTLSWNEFQSFIKKGKENEQVQQ